MLAVGWGVQLDLAVWERVRAPRLGRRAGPGRGGRLPVPPEPLPPSPCCVRYGAMCLSDNTAELTVGAVS